MRASRPRVLVLAGVDSSGGAGLDADRETIEALGGEPLCVATCWTRQDERGLAALDPVPAAEVWGAVGEHLAAGVAALKIGALPGAGAVSETARRLAELRSSRPALPVVLDPVLGPSRGGTFLDEEALAVLGRELLPTGPLLTPNLMEAARLLGLDPASLEDLERRVEAARALCSRGARACLLKGGHGAEDPVLDLVLERDAEPVWHAHPRTAGAKLAGSGCRYASALATGLARGLGLAEAAGQAGSFVAARVAAAGQR